MVTASISSVLKKNRTLIFFIIWSFWISAEFLLGPFSHVLIGDNGESFLPQLIGSRIQFFKFGLSYFSDYMASGVDSSAQFLLPFSNLNSTLFILLPGWLAYGFLMFTQRFLASYFTFRLCRDSLKLNYWPSLIAGLLFSFYNFNIFSFTTWNQLGLPALPFIIWIIEKIITFAKRKYFLLAVFGLFIGYANYFVYFTPFILPFLFIWFFYIKREFNKKTFTSLLIFSFFVILVQSQSMLAVFENAKFSHRSLWNNLPRDFDLQSVIRSILIDLKGIFINFLIPIAILVLTFKKSHIKNGLPKRLLSVGAAIIVISTVATATHDYLPNSVFVTGFSVNHIAFLTPFIFAITSAVFLTGYKGNQKLFKLIVLVLFLFSFKIKIDTLLNYSPYLRAYSQPDLINLSKNIDGTKWRVVTLLGTGFRSSYPLAYGIYNVDTYLTLYPKTYHNFWAKVMKGIETNGVHYPDFMKIGNRIYLYAPEPFGRFQAIDFEKYYSLDLLSLANVKYIIAPKPLISKNLALLPSQYRDNFSWEHLNTLQKLTIFIKGDFFGPPLYIYENKKVLPRFFVLEGNDINPHVVEIIKYSPDKIELNVEAKDNSQLVASINYYPFWSVSINGVKSSFERYENTFMAVPIPSGKSHIIMEYKPPYRISFK